MSAGLMEKTETHVCVPVCTNLVGTLDVELDLLAGEGSDPACVRYSVSLFLLRITWQRERKQADILEGVSEMAGNKRT